MRASPPARAAAQMRAPRARTDARRLRRLRRASEVNDKLSGELRVQLCRAKNSGVAKGTKPIANAGARCSLAPRCRG